MRTAVVVALAVLAQAIGNILLSKGMKLIAASSEAAGFSPHMLIEAMQNPLIWIGTLLLIAFFALFAAALSWADLSLVLPATAFGYILNVSLARYYLGEPVSQIRWAGTVLIFAGVVLVSKSGPKEKGLGCKGGQPVEEDFTRGSNL